MPEENNNSDGPTTVSSIRDFYKNRNVLITGATGFLGKIMVEKFMRSCGDIGTIYVLLRPKKGLTVEERLKELLSREVFNKAHEENPSARNKVVAIEGDLSDANFAMHERDRALLASVVSVVFHSAATIKFDEEMKQAVNTNVRGTKHIVDLAKTMKNLKAFVYISTAYSNSDRRVIEEKYYPMNAPPFFWKDIITAVEKMDENDLNALSASLVGKLPNNYTFTKQVTESLIFDHKDDIPVVIYRPSIVTGSFYEPYPGWVDNVNGFVGVVAAIYTGAMNLVIATPDTRQDYIGVDMAVNGAIVAACRRAQDSSSECTVYNCAVGDRSPAFSQLVPFINQFRHRAPTAKTVWRPGAAMTASPAWFRLHFIVTKVFPALLLDVVLRYKGIKFSAVKVCRKIITLCRVLTFFTTTTFDIRNEKYIQLHEQLSDEDKKIFDFSLKTDKKDLEKLMAESILGVKRYILKDDMSEKSIERLKSRMKYYDMADMAIKIIFYVIFVNILWKIIHYAFF